MKVVILAGGYGTRISEETHSRPKPMVLIGERPILWHIMKTFSHFGFNEFVICLGYKGHMIKEYFANYIRDESDLILNYASGSVQHQTSGVEPWNITLVNTGRDSMTGGRVKRIQPYIGDEPFMLTYGDGLCNLDYRKLLEFHQSHGKLATVTAVQPAGRFGALDLGAGDQVKHFKEKIKGDGKWVNGGFMVLQPEVFQYLEGDHTIFEEEPLINLASRGQLHAFKHEGFWYAMDTLRDKQHLQGLWDSQKAPWKLW